MWVGELYLELHRGTYTTQARIKQAGPPVPEQTIETVKEDVEWAKTQMRSDRT